MNKKTRIFTIFTVIAIIAVGVGIGAATQANKVEDFLQIAPTEKVSTDEVTDVLAKGVRHANKQTAPQIKSLQKQGQTWVGNAKGSYFKLPDFGKRSDVMAGQVNDNLIQAGQFTQSYAIQKPQIFIADTKYAANTQIVKALNSNAGAFANQMLGQLPQLSNMKAKQLNKDVVVVSGYSDQADTKKGQVKEYISFIFTRDQLGNLHMISVESRQDKASVAKNIATLSSIGHSFTAVKPENVNLSKSVQK